MRFQDGNPFRIAYCSRKYPGPPGSAPIIISARDRIQYSLFDLNILPVLFHAILRRQPFSHAQLRTLIPRQPRECSFYNFHARPLLIIVIWPKYATCAISNDSETATLLARAIAHANTPALPEALFLSFSCATISNIRYLA